MAANVPTIDMGRARLGMTVAERLRRKRKITITTRTTVSMRVNLTSLTESRIDSERSKRTFRVTEAAIWDLKTGSRALIASTTSTVFVPGCRCTARTMARVPVNQEATLSFSTLSITRPRSSRRTGEPFR